MSVWKQCVSCGEALELQALNSRMIACEKCRRLMHRYGESLEDYGSLPELTATGTRLVLGNYGEVKGQRFHLTGRTQLQQEAGAIWDEWYATLEDGGWAWIAETQGRLFCTFEQKVEGDLPKFENLDVGQSVEIPGIEEPLTVKEKGKATVKTAQGELPWLFKPEDSFEFVDLEGPKGDFGTLQYLQGECTLFLGVELSYDDFKDADQKPEEKPITTVCPGCNKELTIYATRRTVRVVCPKCTSLSKWESPQLTLLTARKKKSSRKLAIKIGSVGQFPEGELRVLGNLRRSIRIQGTNYYWEEYLLYNPKVGFRWLIQSDHHWTLAKPISSGEVRHTSYQASIGMKTFTKFSSGKATVREVLGEIYWEVRDGETVDVCDYVRPPMMLSMELTKEGGAKEINWSLGEYLTPDQVEKSFGISGLRRPSTVGPNQPFPHRKIYFYWFILFLVLLGIGIFARVNAERRVIFQKWIYTEPNAKVKYFQSEPMKLTGGQNLEVTARTGSSKTWILVNGTLRSMSSSAKQNFGLSLGRRDRSKTIYVSAPEEGEYRLTLTLDRSTSVGQDSVHVTLRQNSPRTSTWLWAMLWISVGPIITAFVHMNFVSQRWKDSN